MESQIKEMENFNSEYGRIAKGLLFAAVRGSCASRCIMRWAGLFGVCGKRDCRAYCVPDNTHPVRLT